MIGWAAFIIACLALAHSIRMKNWIERIQESEVESRPLLEQPEQVWRRAGVL